MKMETSKSLKSMGWEIAREIEVERPSVLERLKPDARSLRAAAIATMAFLAVFLVGCWLSSSPFEATRRVASEAVRAEGLASTDQWCVFGWVVVAAVVLEFLDAAAGMGYGTAITPLLLVFGFDVIQIVPAVMIQQATAGLLGAYLHNEFGNVRWRFRPMSETIKLWLIISSFGVLAVALSITAVYGFLDVAKVWIKLYVAALLLAMGAMSLVGAKMRRSYRPSRMLFFGALAGFNKGIGGGGYGPVVTVGGLLSGVPPKSMMAVTALSEGSVCIAAIVAWFCMLAQGVSIDFVLLPSMMLGSMIAAVAAPYVTRVLPERIWKVFVPVYCCLLAGYCFFKIVPQILEKIL